VEAVKGKGSKISPINTRVQLLHICKSNHVSLQYAITLLQKSNQRIKLGLVCGRLLANRHVVWMPFSELTVCLILDEAEGKEDVGDELLLGVSVAKSNPWYVSLLLRWETMFPSIIHEEVMHEIPAFLWQIEQIVCPRQVTDKRPECLTVHLIATVYSEFRHDALHDGGCEEEISSMVQ